MISYAQNFEDVILNRCFADRKDGFYIDVGAWDPVIDSVTKYFYDEGWSGINIEPNKLFYDKLSQARPRDINLNLALGETQETRQMYVFEQYGNSTFEASNRDRFAEQGHAPTEEAVQITTLAAICSAYATRDIDFLKIDCEGWETFVIKGADWERFRPFVVIVEATEPMSKTPAWSDWEPLLIDNGRYEMVYFDGLNRFYLRCDRPEFRRYFEVPPNVFDDFTTYSMHELYRANTWLMGIRDDLTEKLNSQSAQLAELNVQCQELALKLQKTRLWVGQLSQDLAASRLR